MTDTKVVPLEPTEITFVNGSNAPCGCRLHFSDGRGEFSDVHRVELCDQHSGRALLRKVVNTGELTRPQHEELEGDVCSHIGRRAAPAHPSQQPTPPAPQEGETPRTERDGWNYNGKPMPELDARKLVTLKQGGMVWVGIRAYHHRWQEWFNNGEPEPVEVIAWQDLPEPATGFWSNGILHIPEQRDGGSQ